MLAREKLWDAEAAAKLKEMKAAKPRRQAGIAELVASISEERAQYYATMLSGENPDSVQFTRNSRSDADKSAARDVGGSIGYIASLAAISWAFNRLKKRKEERKILMVISDGAPVDDSTLSVNSGDFLEKHLKKIVKYIEEKSDIEILAIGIGHDVSRYYKKAIKISDVQELGDVMISQLSGLFQNKKQKLH